MTPAHRSTTRHRQGDAPARMALVVVALLFGLLGMHALSVGHDVMPGRAGAMSPMSGPVTAAAGDAGGTAHAGPGVATDPSGHVSTRAATASTDDGDDDGHGMGGMLMLCLAVLGAAAALLLGRVLARGLSWWRPAPHAALAPRVTATHRVRSRRPPPVWEFSVIRC